MPVPKLTALPGMTPGCGYEITYRRHSQGPGDRTGSGIYVYNGPADEPGLHRFTPADGGPPVDLLADEVSRMSPR